MRGKCLRLFSRLGIGGAESGRCSIMFTTAPDPFSPSTIWNFLIDILADRISQWNHFCINRHASSGHCRTPQDINVPCPCKLCFHFYYLWALYLVWRIAIDTETMDIPSMRLQEPLFCYVNAPMVNVISVWGCLVSAYSATVLDLLYCLLCFAIQSLFDDALAVIFSSSGFCEWRCHSSSFLRQGHSFWSSSCQWGW